MIIFSGDVVNEKVGDFFTSINRINQDNNLYNPVNRCKKKSHPVIRRKRELDNV